MPMMPMGWGGGGWGFGWGLFNMLFMLFFWILVIVGGVFLFRWAMEQGRSERRPGPHEEPALEILKKRYARGEIDKEEFEAKRRDLL